MNRKCSRRLFLKTSIGSSVALGTLSITTLVSPAPVSNGTSQGPGSHGIDPKLRDLLHAAMDTLIPPADGMPSASAAGGLSYLEQLAESDPETRMRLERSLKAVDQVSLDAFKSDFLHLAQDQRIDVLKKLESRQPPEVFGDLRDYVYESYYTQPKVWKLIGYDFHPTNHKGPQMKSFDESALSNVKKMPKLFREVS